MRKLLLTAIIFSALSITSVHAVSVNDISVDFDSQSVTITGSGTPNENVVIQIINPGKDIPAPETGYVEGVFNHFGNTAVNEDGNFEYKFIMSGVTTTDENKYRARVAADSGLIEKEFDFTSIDDINNKLALINSAADKETMKETVEQTMDLLAFSPIAPYAGMSDADKLQIAEKMLIAKPFANIDNMIDSFNKCILIQALHNETDKAEFKNLLTTYAAELFDDIYQTALNETGQNKSIDILHGNIKNAADYEGLKFNFNAANLLACGQTATKNNMVNALVAYIDIFKTADNSMSAYVNSFTSASNETKATIAGRILDRAPSDIAQMAKIIKDYFTPSQTPGGGSGGSGSGGGSVKRENAAEGPDLLVVKPQTESEKNMFADVDESHWAYDAISYLHKKGVINGKGNGRFESEDLVTRAEMITMLVTAFNVGQTNGERGFNDVTENDWYYKYVTAAAAIDVAQGVGDGNFAPQANVTREDMAVFLNRILSYKGKQLAQGDESVQFEDDSEISDYAKTAVYAMKKAGIISGRADGRFVPKAYATRAEMAQLLYIALQSI